MNIEPSKEEEDVTNFDQRLVEPSQQGIDQGKKILMQNYNLPMENPQSAPLPRPRLPTSISQANSKSCSYTTMMGPTHVTNLN